MYHHNSIRLYNAAATIAKCVMLWVRLLTFIISFNVLEQHLCSKTALLILALFGGRRLTANHRQAAAAEAPPPHSYQLAIDFVIIAFNRKRLPYKYFPICLRGL